MPEARWPPYPERTDFVRALWRVLYPKLTSPNAWIVWVRKILDKPDHDGEDLVLSELLKLEYALGERSRAIYQAHVKEYHEVIHRDSPGDIPEPPAV